jgi:7,8-dihydro-6-hydroxymethylpterin dimethyltransferase
MSDSPHLLRATRGTCPICVEMVDARVLEDEGCVYIAKDCPEHGENRALLSRNPAYFRELMEYYFDLLPDSLPQRDYILRLTGRCNMQCPICLASADDYEEQDLTLPQLREFMTGRKRMKLDLMGAEPTLWADLETLIREADERGHITALHTNGIQIADPDKLQRLVDAGLKEVHLQFDGFEDEHDEVLRGQPMSGLRGKVLDNLERLNVATDLVVTVLQGLNEGQMERVLDYANEHPFVKEVFYLGCRPLGRATEDFQDRCLTPDEVLDLLIERTGGKVNRDDLRAFQKLYFALLAIMGVRKCFYIHHYLVLRDPRGYRPISDFIDLRYLEPRLDRFRHLFRQNRTAAISYLGLHCAVAVSLKGGYRLLMDGLLMNLLLWLGFDLSRLSRKIILLGSITACDPWIHDEAVSANCGKGEVANDIGVNESGADANVGRERYHRSVSGGG